MNHQVPKIADAPPEPQPAQGGPVWRDLLALSAYARAPAFDPGRPLELRLDAHPGRVSIWHWRPLSGWEPHVLPEEPGMRALLDLYLPLCRPPASRCELIGHLGQSLDGFIATPSGDSCYVTGPGNICHLHRMRALCDAVLVGTETAARDDPRLTTRLVPGPNPLRVVLDRRRRLQPGLRLFEDGAAETLVICDRDLLRSGEGRVGRARLVGVASRAGRLDLAAVVSTLEDLGVRRAFVEGGGATVSGFLSAGLLTGLQIAIAPLIIGGGRPGLRLAAPERLAQARRPSARVFRMGADLLYDLTLARPPVPPDAAANVLERVL